MERSGLNPDQTVDLERADVLLVDANPQSLVLLGSALKGFGVQRLQRCSTAFAAQAIVQKKSVDLIIVDSNLPEMDGYEFVDWLRHSELDPNAYTAVVMVTGYTATSKIKRARDCGANFIVAKPFSPSVLLERIIWVARDPRPFVEAGPYIGPDRRHKFERPPEGWADRRRPLEEAAELNAKGAA